MNIATQIAYAEARFSKIRQRCIVLALTGLYSLRKFSRDQGSGFAPLSTKFADPIGSGAPFLHTILATANRPEGEMRMEVWGDPRRAPGARSQV